ncbi:hypothetical protein [Neptunitalea lumnitzerae]|nr:hypothetical protein [Neptunitalea sp. Y10]
MKNLFLLLVLLPILVFSQENEPVVFVGFINKEPVFDNYKKHKLYNPDDLFEDSILVYPETYALVKVQDSTIVYTTNDQTIVSVNGKETTYNLYSAFIAIDSLGSVYVTDYDDALKVKKLTSGKIVDTGIKGYVVSILDTDLYVTREHDPNIIHTNADLFKINLETKLTTKVATNISGEDTIVFNSGLYIYDTILKDGTFQPAVYDVKKDKYIMLELSDTFSNSLVYDNYIDRKLVFYKNIKHPKTTQFSTYGISY